jgi:hypothetical protein
VFPYSSSSGGLLAVPTGALQVIAQALPGGATSNTFAAIEGLYDAAQDENTINVVTFSGGAQAFSSAVTWLESNGLDRITSMIGTITYVAPGGGGGPLYNNGSVTVLQGGGGTNLAAFSATWFGGGTAVRQPTFDTDLSCGHNFSCIVDWALKNKLMPSAGDACSDPMSINEPDMSFLTNPVRLVNPTYGDPFWYLDLMGLLTPVVTTSISYN